MIELSEILDGLLADGLISHEIKKQLDESLENSKKFQELRDVFKEDSPLELAILIKILDDFKKHSRCGICGMVTPEHSIDSHIELHQVETIKNKVIEENKSLSEENARLKERIDIANHNIKELKLILEKTAQLKNNLQSEIQNLKAQLEQWKTDYNTRAEKCVEYKQQLEQYKITTDEIRKLMDGYHKFDTIITSVPELTAILNKIGVQT